MTGNSSMLVCHVIPGRSQAPEVAAEEMRALLASHSLSATVVPGGPGAEEKGQKVYIKCDASVEDISALDFSGLGYVGRVVTPEPIDENRFRDRDPDHVRWKKNAYQMKTLYEEDHDLTLARGPDRRKFFLDYGENGGVTEITGYRGDGGQFSKRALAVCDAKMLVNLVRVEDGKFLDLFAGAGGVVQEAIAAGMEVHSCDIDPVLRPGLEYMGANHIVGDSTELPYEFEYFDAIATETPYDIEASEIVLKAFDEMVRVLKVDGKMSVLCTPVQAEALRRQAKYANSPLELVIDSPINRKGYDCVLLCWRKGEW